MHVRFRQLSAAAWSIFCEKELQQYPCQLFYTLVQLQSVQPMPSYYEYDNSTSNNTGCPWIISTVQPMCCLGQLVQVNTKLLSRKPTVSVLKSANRALTGGEKHQYATDNCDKEHSHRRQHWCQKWAELKIFSFPVQLTHFISKFRLEKPQGANLLRKAPSPDKGCFLFFLN